MLLFGGIALLSSCNDSAPSPTEPLNASFSAAQQGKKDRVTGEGVIVATYPFAVNAHSGPDGEKPSGQFDNTFIQSGRYKVSCLAVSGNRAVVGAVNPVNPGADVFLLVEDNGPPGSVVPDRGSEMFGGGAATDEFCRDILRFSFPLDQAFVIEGDVEVTDNTSAP
jgi:hypothetical protein